MRAYERFLRYIAFDTMSDEANSDCPSTPSQRAFGQMLAEEMRGIGIADARMDEHGYVYGRIPANVEGAPVIGLIAHMDTAAGVPASPMKARVVRNYEGGDIALDEAGRVVTRADEFPLLARCRGKDLIVTDGGTLLGADDKAGVAEILTLCEHLIAHPEFAHAGIAVCFTPDEEIGRGADRFDVAGFGADFAYTVDGGPLAEIEYENFNAASATLEVHGVNIHPGNAKNKMKNALLMAVEFQNMLPAAEIPAHTEGYEGFYHLNASHGAEELARLHYIVRDHDMARFLARKEHMRSIAAFLNEKYGEGSFALTLKDSYYNMKEKLLDHMHVVERAMNAMRAAGFTPTASPIRGGTDGARLSYMGLPCPNLSTGGMNGHSRHEMIAIQDMDAVVEILKNIVAA